jgi:hypothetical protein
MLRLGQKLNVLPVSLDCGALQAKKNPAEPNRLSGASRKTFITQPPTPTGALSLRRYPARGQ